MKTYWDLSEKERAALSRDEVAQYLDAELMVKGVLKVAPLVQQPEPKMPEPTGTCFRIRHGSYRELDCAFKTAEAAQAFIAGGGQAVESTWTGNDNQFHLIPIEGAQIIAIKIMTKAEHDACGAQLKEAVAVRTANAKAREEHDKAMRAQDEALEGLWDDWQRCREKAERMGRVAETMAEYTRIAGDERVAVEFLEKAFSANALEEAEEWHGRPFRTHTMPEQAAEAASA